MKFIVILCEVLILGITHLTEAVHLSDQFYIRQLAPSEGHGYDLFYYDGISLRDEKWRFDHANHDTAVHRRFGLRNAKSSQFHVIDTLSDANGFRQRSRFLSDPESIERLVMMGVEPPTTRDNYHKCEILTRKKLRDNSDQEGQPRNPILGLLNGVTLGVTLNEPTSPGGSYIQGFVQTGVGAQNNQPGLQFGIPNLGILSGNRPTSDVTQPSSPLFGLPFFGNAGMPQSPPPSPPPSQNQPSFFGLPFGNRNPPPPSPTSQPAQPYPPQQPSFLAGLQNFNIPFIGQPQTTTPTTTTTTEASTSNPSFFGNFQLPNFGFQNNNKPSTTQSFVTTTPTPQGPFGNFQLPFSNFGRTSTSSTTVAAPESTIPTKRPFGFDLPFISGNTQGHEQPPNSPQDQYGVTEKSVTSTTVQVESSTYEFPEPEDKTETILQEVNPNISNKLEPSLPNGTGLLPSKAVEPSTVPDIPPPIQKPLVESLLAVVDNNLYALGMQETFTQSFSNVEPTKSSSTQPIALSRSDETDQTTFENVSVDPIPNIPQTVIPNVIEQTTTTETIAVINSENTDQIVSDINSLSSNPPFPALLSDVAQPPLGLPYPLLNLVPPFETKPGDLGLHEEIVLSKTDSTQLNNFDVPKVPGIIELLQSSQKNKVKETTIQPEVHIANIKHLEQDLPQPPIELKSSEIIRINSLEPKSKVNLPETDILPPFENDSEEVSTTLSTPFIIHLEPYNDASPGVDLLPRFESNSVSDVNQNLSKVDFTIENTLTTIAPDTTTQNTPYTSKSTTLQNVVPETDLVPPFKGITKVKESTTTVTTTVDDVPKTTMTTSTTTIQTTTTPNTISVEINSLVQPEVDLRPPFETVLLTTNIPKIETTTTSTPRLTLNSTETSLTPSYTIPVIDLLPPFENLSSASLNTTDNPKTNVNAQVVDVNLISRFAEVVSDIPKTTSMMTTTPRQTTREQSDTIGSTIGTVRNYTIPEIDLLPPFKTTIYTLPTTVPPTILTTKITTTTEVPFIRLPESDLLPPFTVANNNGTNSNVTKSIRFDVQTPEIDLLPPTVSEETATVKTSTTSVTPIVITLPTTVKVASDLVEKLPEIDLLPPFKTTTYTLPPTTLPTILSSKLTIKPRTTTSTRTTPMITTRTTEVPIIRLPESDLLLMYKNVTNSNVTNSIRVDVRTPEIDLLPPLGSTTLPPTESEEPITVKIVTTSVTSISNTLPTATTQKITKTDKKVEPIYQRSTTVATTTQSPITDNIVRTTTVPSPTQKGVSQLIPTTNTQQTTTPHETSSFVTTVTIPPPSKFFLPPFETTLQVLNTAESSTVKTTKQLDDETTIRMETDKIVNSVREIIEHTSQSVLPTSGRYERSSTTRQPNQFTSAQLRNLPKHNTRHHNRHQYHSHGRYPEYGLIPPPIRRPGQVDVYDLETRITQGGLNLGGLIVYPKIPERDLLPPFETNVNEMQISPVLITPQPPQSQVSQTDSNVLANADPFQMTTEGAVRFNIADSELTTKPANGIKRPVFVNVDEESDTETTTSILDIKLSPNAIKSLIG